MEKAVDAHAGLLRLKGVVQHYDWGGYDFIPELIGVPNHAREPFAELWVGAHPKAPSWAETAAGERSAASPPAIRLDRLIANAPEEIVGPEHARFGGRLPYLLKVLDVAKMLSIQAHPTKEQAAEGFAREHAAGIGLNAAERNYRDDNHKPEIGVALTDFWMLHGFRPLEQIAETLHLIPELHSIMPEFPQRLARQSDGSESRAELLREFYSRVMTMPQERVDLLLDALLLRLERQAPTEKDMPDYWAVRAARTFPLPGGHRDRGIFSIYLLNLVHLRPGQGTFQPAGVLHAYLEGANVELMANSDNVLRGGLTPKHVDVEELLRVLRFASGAPEVLDGELVNETERVYRTPAEEFELSRIDLGPHRPYMGNAADGPELIIVLEGTATSTADGRSKELIRGSMLLARFGAHYVIDPGAGSAVLFKAAIPKLHNDMRVSVTR